jgi:hypothetical protein
MASTKVDAPAFAEKTTRVVLANVSSPVVRSSVTS